MVGLIKVTVLGGGGGGTTGSKCNRIFDFSIDGRRITPEIISGSITCRDEASLTLLGAYVL